MNMRLLPCRCRAPRSHGRPFCFFVPLSLPLFLLGAALFLSPLAASAAANDQTMLYYLLEMQRRLKKTCNGQPMPEAPSLLPSEALRELARAKATTDQDPASGGLEGIPFVALTARGANPRQAADALTAAQCAEVMGRDYRRVGAYNKGEQWTVILAAAEPGAHAQSLVGQEIGPDSVSARASGAAFAQDTAGSAAPGTREIRVNPDGALVLSEPEATAAPGGSPGISGPSDMPEGAPEGGEAAPAFIPPTGPGPFGRREEPSASAQSGPASGPASGVVPLQDTRTGIADGTGIFAREEGNAPSAVGGGAPIRSQAGAVPSQAGEAPTRTDEAQPAPAFKGTADIRKSVVIGADQNDLLLWLVNEVRAGGHTCGGVFLPPAAPLAADPRLASAAAAQARDMASRGYLSSTSPEGRTLGQRVSAAGYVWGFVAENLAAGTTGAEQTLKSWLGNDSQCSNLLGQEFTEAGIGFDPGRRLWVFTLAAPMEQGAIRMR